MLQATAGLRCCCKSNTLGPPCLSTNVRRHHTMRLPRNNWEVLGGAFGAWLLSWVFMAAFHEAVGNWGFYAWTVVKAALGTPDWPFARKMR